VVSDCFVAPLLAMTRTYAVIPSGAKQSRSTAPVPNVRFAPLAKLARQRLFHADQRLYRQRQGMAPAPITPDPAQPRGLRYADGGLDAARSRMIWVREDHMAGTPQPVNALVRGFGVGAERVIGGRSLLDSRC
jgi:hypothetical protein